MTSDVMPPQAEPTSEEQSAILKDQREKQIGMIDRTISVLVGGIELFSAMTFKGSELRKGADFLDYMQSLKTDLKGQMKALQNAMDTDAKKKPELVEA